MTTPNPMTEAELEAIEVQRGVRSPRRDRDALTAEVRHLWTQLAVAEGRMDTNAAEADRLRARVAELEQHERERQRAASGIAPDLGVTLGHKPPGNTP